MNAQQYITSSSSSTSLPVDIPKKKTLSFPIKSSNILSPNKYNIVMTCIYDKNNIYNMLNKCFQHKIGIHLPTHLFFEIWSRIEHHNLNDYFDDYDDFLPHIDDLYYDIIHKSARKHKKTNKTNIRFKRSCKFFIDE